MEEKNGYPPGNVDVYPIKDFQKSTMAIDPTFADQKPPKMSKARIIKNLIVVSLGFLCLFTSFSSLSNLQSSLNKEDGLGTGGLATIYGALVLSCLFLPPVIIAKMGCKWTVAFSMLCYILYMGANFYAVWATIIPTAVILGFGAAPLWSAKCTYLTQTGVWYSKQTGEMEDVIINRFFGVFFMIFQSSKYQSYVSHGHISSSKRKCHVIIYHYDVAVIQWITLCHKNHMATRVITLWQRPFQQCVF